MSEQPATNRYSPQHDPMEVDMPTTLADLSIAQILEVLHALTCAIENKYAAQLLRYYAPPDERQCQLWDEKPFDDDVPF
jgi:hypothetical protein